MKFVEKHGAIEASATYYDNTLVSNDRTFTLPEVTFLTADVQAMGTTSLPLQGLIDDMETTMSKEGIDNYLAKMSVPGIHTLEHRWVQDVTKADGSVVKEGCKVFMRVIPERLLPGASFKIGSASENDIAWKVTRIRLVVNGKETLLVDRFKHILKVNSKDYYKNISKYL